MDHRHALRAGGYALEHRDPFDRMLAAQSELERLPLATRDVPTRGNLVPDAHLAAVLRQSGVATLYTHDRDFGKFAFLDVRVPLAE